MTQTAFTRDNILSPEDRLASARKCLTLLAPETGGMGEKEATFVEDMENKIDHFGVSERQLAWLRDLGNQVRGVSIQAEDDCKTTTEERLDAFCCMNLNYERK